MAEQRPRAGDSRRLEQIDAYLKRVGGTRWLFVNANWPSRRCLLQPGKPGVYRLFQNERVVYLGESTLLRTRLTAHMRRPNGSELSASWVEMEDALPHHLKERETDLIGAFFKTAGAPPLLQYSPGRGR